MKSAIFYGKHSMKVEETVKPNIEENDILIKVMACGVCGTDVHIYEGDEGAAACTPPTTLGHEFSGIVEAIGEGVTNIKVGEKVCVDPNNICGECYYCREGIGHFCESMIGIGTTTNGGFSQYCAVNKKQVHKIGEHTTFEAGAMAEPVACCLHGIDMSDIKPGSNVMVIGGGMIGLIMLQLAKIEGANKIILLEPVQGKRDMARKLGADICIDPLNEDVESILKSNKIERINTVIECAGLKSTIKQAIEYAGKKSTVMMFGLTKPNDTIDIKPFDIFKKEIVLKSSFINPYTQDRAIKLIDSGKLDVTSMVHEVCSLEKLEEVLSNPELRTKGKYIVNPWL
ncbi:zinc-dependent alcohol dehydrogenase family protein [Paraclostridium ghonii]|uniref:Threonine dehydrogenase-like Zn-dependent dehydrogenase n=1 Tax=Paraclostridium ghonii TaxID=29358 RepID=A0ABU0N0A1_9FIRM|nr:zinc-dependent alcohol dehydrogenase family protein [Paeniclostridium ghonii]MDQ0556404.1 threonine dehydrogenase-like Zn-dependent dehydrogenase [Paeniclostridium ghonii]